jgi:hypothetical protein
MVLDTDEIDIQLRSPADVGRRMIALSAVSHLLGGCINVPNDQLDDEAVEDEEEDSAAERFDWLAWLTQEQIVLALAPSERALMGSSLGDGSLADLDDEGAAGEALGALAWAVRLSALTVLDRGYPYLDLLDIVPSPWDETTPFLTGLTLRPEGEIANARRPPRSSLGELKPRSSAGRPGAGTVSTSRTRYATWRRRRPRRASRPSASMAT